MHVHLSLSNNYYGEAGTEIFNNKGYNKHMGVGRELLGYTGKRERLSVIGGLKEYRIGNEIFPYLPIRKVGSYIVPRVPSLPKIDEFRKGQVRWNEACVVHDTRSNQSRFGSTARPFITPDDFLRLTDIESTTGFANRWNLVAPTAPHNLFCHCLCIQKPLSGEDAVVADMGGIEEEEAAYLLSRFGEGAGWALAEGAERVSVGAVYGPWRSQKPSHFHITGFDSSGNCLDLADLKRIDPRIAGLFRANKIGVVTMGLLAHKLRTRADGLDGIFDFSEFEDALPFSSGALWIVLRRSLPEALQSPDMAKVWTMVEELIRRSWLDTVDLYNSFGEEGYIGDFKQKLCFAIAGFQTKASKRGVLAIMAAGHTPDGFRPRGGVVEAMGDALCRSDSVSDLKQAALFHLRTRKLAAAIADIEFDKAKFADVYSFLERECAVDRLSLAV